MKLGIVIPCYNRAAYLKDCLNSVLKSDIPENTLFILINDGSKDPSVGITMTLFADLTNTIVFNKTNSGVHKSLLLGFDTAFAKGCDVVMNLDSDAIVSKDWITRLLALHEKHSHTIVSGFNTLSQDGGTGKPRHPVTEERQGYVTKRSIGGINMCFNADVYYRTVRNNLIGNTHWDWMVSYEMQWRGIPFVVSKPSVVQHIGVEGLHTDNPDVAHDFVNN